MDSTDAVATGEAVAVLEQTGLTPQRLEDGSYSMTGIGLKLVIDDAHVSRCEVHETSVVFDLDDYRINVTPKSFDLRALVLPRPEGASEGLRRRAASFERSLIPR